MTSPQGYNILSYCVNDSVNAIDKKAMDASMSAVIPLYINYESDFTKGATYYNDLKVESSWPYYKD